MRPRATSLAAVRSRLCRARSRGPCAIVHRSSPGLRTRLRRSTRWAPTRVRCARPRRARGAACARTRCRRTASLRRGRRSSTALRGRRGCSIRARRTRSAAVALEWVASWSRTCARLAWRKHASRSRLVCWPTRGSRRLRAGCERALPCAGTRPPRGRRSCRRIRDAVRRGVAPTASARRATRDRQRGCAARSDPAAGRTVPTHRRAARSSGSACGAPCAHRSARARGASPATRSSGSRPRRASCRCRGRRAAAACSCRASTAGALRRRVRGTLARSRCSA